ncbi:MAG: CPBP family glutamic-type intramembrane protease [Candidatus Acidiferrum sp.]
MKWSGHRWSCLAEALAFVVFVGAYIWKLQAAAPWTWWILLIWLVASFILRGDTPKTMGWRGDNFWKATKRAWPFFAVGAGLIFFGGLFLGMLHRLPTHFIEPRRFGGYLAFCLLQQVGLNSFLTNRLMAAFERPGTAALVAGTAFAALHWPNPVLVPLTFVGGVAMAWLFATERNILPLTLGQAILGALVWWAFPIAWHHSMRVGPGYWEFRAK